CLLSSTLHPPVHPASHWLPSPLFVSLFFFNAPPTTEIYTLSLHDALPIYLHDRGSRERCHLDQVEAPLLRRRQRFLDGQHAELSAIGSDHPAGTDPDSTGHTNAGRLAVGTFDCPVPVSSSSTTHADSGYRAS